MGTDIHGVFQRYDGSRWLDIQTEYGFDRHYQLFAVLADVRNGFGFAGHITGQKVEPISAPRGYPKDFDVDNDRHPTSLPSDEGFSWMGEHSFSWLTAEEMMEWYSKAGEVYKVGVLDRRIYESWDKVSIPSEFLTGISGYDVRLIGDTEEFKAAVPDWTHIKCIWKASLKEELAYFFNEVERLRQLHGQVRFVFGFDS